MNRKKMKRRGILFLSILFICGMSVTGAAADTLKFPDNMKAEIDLEQNGGILRDANARKMKKTLPSAAKIRKSFPEKYDLREEERTTSVKFQNPWGTCWAFGALASLESSAVTNGEGAANSVDYSEKALVWFSKQLQSNGTTGAVPEGISIAETDSEKIKQGIYNMGGNSSLVAGELATWKGASLEEQVPYKNAEGTTTTVEVADGKYATFYQDKGDWSVDNSHENDDAYRMYECEGIMGQYMYQGQDAEVIKNRILSDINPTVKNWLMENGAIGISYCSDQASPDDVGQTSSVYFNKKSNAQYNPNTDTPNHGVAIVGWDDTYSKDNFSITPPGDGAWIVKNSWSDLWGDEGYFYLSYYDMTVDEYITMISDVEKNGYYRYDNNYQYDYMGGKSSVGVMVEGTIINNWNTAGITDVSLANIFQAEEDEVLKAVGSMDYRGLEEPVEIQIEVYLLDDNKKPVSGKPVAVQTEQSNGLVFNVTELDDPVELEKGQYFSVVQKMQLLTPGSESFLLPIEFGTDQPIQVTGYDGKTKYNLSYTVSSKEGESFMKAGTKEDNTGWIDLTSEKAQQMLNVSLGQTGQTKLNSTSGNAMIKAYTVDADTLLDLSNETLVLTFFDANGEKIGQIENPDISTSVEVPQNAASLSFSLGGSTGSKISGIACGGKVYAAGEKIAREVFKDNSVTLTLLGTERGETAQKEYTITFHVGAQSEQGTEQSPSYHSGDAKGNVVSANSDKKAKNSNSGTVKTGDERIAVLRVAFFLLLAAIGAMIILKRKRKTEKQEEKF